jgi:hypothetical protein
VILEVEMFCLDSLVFPIDSIVIGHGGFEELDEAFSLLEGEVSESYIYCTAYTMWGPFVMPIEGIVGGDDSGGEVLAEDSFESLDDIDESLFKFGVKLHDYEWFLKGVIHYVVMGWTCLQRDIVTDVVNGRGVILLGREFCGLMGPTAIR